MVPGIEPAVNCIQSNHFTHYYLFGPTLFFWNFLITNVELSILSIPLAHECVKTYSETSKYQPLFCGSRIGKSRIRRNCLCQNAVTGGSEQLEWLKELVWSSSKHGILMPAQGSKNSSSSKYLEAVQPQKFSNRIHASFLVQAGPISLLHSQASIQNGSAARELEILWKLTTPLRGSSFLFHVF